MKGRQTGPLGDMPLFSGLAPHELARLDDLLRHRSVPAGANLITIDQPGEAAYIILKGTVKVHAEQSDGSDVILAILGPGEVLGEMSVADSLGRSANAETLEPVELAWMDRASFRECLETMPAMTYNLVRILSRRLRMANTQIEALASMDVYGRVARQLLAFAREYGQPAPHSGVTIPLRLTQSDIADLVGASRVRVNQVLVFYKEHNYISIDPSYRITVLDQEALARRCT
jgi:CRP/FNR family transcriptional regulator, cyclic AMP receptor protein